MCMCACVYCTPLPPLQRMKQKYGSLADVFRGLLIVSASPVLMIYGALSFINQSMRKCSCVPITKKLEDDDRNLYLTKTGARLLEMMRQWKWTTVLTYAMYW